MAFKIEELKSLLKRNVEFTDNYVEIQLKLTTGEIIPDTNKPYYEGKSDAYKITLELIEKLQKEEVL